MHSKLLCFHTAPDVYQPRGQKRAVLALGARMYVAYQPRTAHCIQAESITCRPQAPHTASAPSPFIWEVVRRTFISLPGVRDTNETYLKLRHYLQTRSQLMPPVLFSDVEARSFSFFFHFLFSLYYLNEQYLLMLLRLTMIKTSLVIQPRFCEANEPRCLSADGQPRACPPLPSKAATI